MLIGYVSDERYSRPVRRRARIRRRPRPIVGGPVAGDRRGARRPAGRELHRHLAASRLRGETQPDLGARRVAAPVPAALRRAARLRLAEMGPRRRGRRVPRPLPSSSTTWNCGATAGRTSSCATSAGSTSTARGPPCRSRPTAITRRPASTGTRSATAARRTAQFVAAPERSGLYYFQARTPSGCGSRSPGSSRRRGRRARGRAGLEHHLERLQQLRRPQQLHSRRRACRHADRQRPPGPESATATPSSSAGARRRTRRCRSIAPSRSTTSTSTSDHRPHRGPAGLPHRPGRVAAARLARAARASLRLLRRNPAPRRHPRSVAYRVLSSAPIPNTGPGRCTTASSMGLRRGRPADVPGRQRAELRGRDPGLDDASSTTGDQQPGRRRHRRREPLRHPSRVGGEPARRGLHAGRA